MKKPRSDSKLDALDMDQQRQLCEWLLTPGLSYEVVKKEVFEQFNVSTSSSALSSFYQSYVGAYVLQRRRQAVGLAAEVREDLAKTPGQFTDATIDALEQKAFELSQNPMVNPKDVKAIFSLVLKARDQKMTREKWEVEVCEKILFAVNDAKVREIASSAGLSNADKIARLRLTYFSDIDALQASGEVRLPE